jgi:hypothetical protein
MKRKLASEAGRDMYRMRKAIEEPVFGQIKEWRGFQRFSLRGLDNVRSEWKLICMTHNLLKLFRSGYVLEACSGRQKEATTVIKAGYWAKAMLNGWLCGVCLREHRPESDAHKAKPQNHARPSPTN